MERSGAFSWVDSNRGLDSLCWDYIERSELAQPGVVSPVVGLPPSFPLPDVLTQERHFPFPQRDSPSREIVVGPGSSAKIANKTDTGSQLFDT